MENINENCEHENAVRDVNKPNIRRCPDCESTIILHDKAKVKVLKPRFVSED